MGEEGCGNLLEGCEGRSKGVRSRAVLCPGVIWVERKRGGEEERKKVKSGVRWFSKVAVLGRSERIWV